MYPIELPPCFDGCQVESHAHDMLTEGTSAPTGPQSVVFRWKDFPVGQLYSRTVSYDHVVFGW